MNLPSAGQTEESWFECLFLFSPGAKKQNDDPQLRSSSACLTLVCQLSVPSLLAVQAFQWGERHIYWCLGKKAVLRFPMGGQSGQRGPAHRRGGRSPLVGRGEPFRWPSQKWLREYAHHCSPASLDSCSTATGTLQSWLGTPATFGRVAEITLPVIQRTEIFFPPRNLAQYILINLGYEVSKLRFLGTKTLLSSLYVLLVYYCFYWSLQPNKFCILKFGTRIRVSLYSYNYTAGLHTHEKHSLKYLYESTFNISISLFVSSTTDIYLCKWYN